MSFNENTDGTNDWSNTTNPSDEAQALFDIWSDILPMFEDFTTSPTSQIHTYVPHASDDWIDADPDALAYGFSTNTLFNILFVAAAERSVGG